MNRELYEKCQGAHQEFIRMWEQLVNIDTGTGYGEGLNRMGGLVVEFLRSVKADVEIIPAIRPDEGYHIVARFAGKGKGRIMTMAHMDTVFPVGTAEQRPFRMEGDWAYGPGVSDCKGSVLLCLFAMKLMQEMNCSDYEKITLLFNCDEETGSPGSRSLIQDLAKQHEYVLCCEPGQIGDGVVLWRKGSAVLKVETYGKAAHAGSAPEDGRNALVELAYQLGALSQLGNKEKLTTLNFTTLSAGDRTNVIPDYAVAKADIRMVSIEELDRIEQEAQKIVQSYLVSETETKLTLTRNNPPFAQTEATNKLIAQAQAIYGELGMTLKTAGAGGASDANWAASSGAAVLDGLGPVKGGPNHTENEKSNVQSVIPRLYLLIRLFMELGGAK